MMFTVDLKNQLEQYSKEVSEHLVEFLPKASDGQRNQAQKSDHKATRND